MKWSLDPYTWYRVLNSQVQFLLPICLCAFYVRCLAGWTKSEIDTRI